MRLLGSANRKVALIVSTLSVTVISGGALIAMATVDGSDLKMSSPVAPEPGTGLNSGGFDDLMSEVPDEPGVDGRRGSDEPARADVPVDGATKGPKVVKAGRTGAPNGIPRGVLPAYRTAAANLGKVQTGCGMTWPLLAGIGKVESDHASGGRVDDNGTTRGTLLGPVLDGSPGLGKVRDTDKGKLDKQRSWDRPVGPMQITPTVWRKYAVDGNDDERRSPNNVYDASATVGVFLCSQNSDLRDPRGLVQSLLRYNHSTDFVATVLRWMRVYSRSAVTVPNKPGAIPAPQETGNVDRRADPRDVPAVKDPRRKAKPSSSETVMPGPSEKPMKPKVPTVSTLRPPTNLPTIPTVTIKSPTKSPSPSQSPSMSPSPSPSPSPTRTSPTVTQSLPGTPDQTQNPPETPGQTPSATSTGTPTGAPPTDL